MRVIFVCTGNTCRSPMAEALFRAWLDSHGIEGAEVGSAGLAALPGAPASAEAVAVMREVGLDLSAHKAQPLRPALLQGEDLRLVTMTPAQREMLAKLPCKVDCMPVEVADPYGGTVDDYRRCREAIVAALPEVARRIGLTE